MLIGNNVHTLQNFLQTMPTENFVLVIFSWCDAKTKEV